MYHNFYFMLDKLFITLLQTNECLYHWWKKSFSFTSFNSNYNRPKWNGAVRKNSVQGAAINCVNEFLWNYKNFVNFVKNFTFRHLTIPSKCVSINGHSLRKIFSLPLSAEFLNEKLLMKFSSLFIFSCFVAECRKKDLRVFFAGSREKCLFLFVLLKEKCVEKKKFHLHSWQYLGHFLGNF